MEYITANIIGGVTWLFFYITRKDLRREMLIISIVSAPLALLDLLFVPSYWVPQTLGNIPIGLEGFLYSFEMAGVSAVSYEYFTRKHLHKIRNYRHPLLWILILILILPVSLYTSYAAGLNVALGLYSAGLIGMLVIWLARRDLIKSSLIGALSYGTVYFLSLALWFNLFPQTMEWFTLENLPKFFILRVPIYEIIFGLLQGAYWGNIYELLFGYKYD